MQISISVKDAESVPFEIVILDVLGRILQTTQGHITNSRLEEISINISHFSNGAYWVSFRSKNASKTLSFICLR